jgi:Domain of unknown function (DUF4160)
MPRISSFYGSLSGWYWDDHEPPHFHATYAENEILIKIQDLSVYAGHFPSRAFGLLMEWASLHQNELIGNWQIMKQNLLLKSIEP